MANLTIWLLLTAAVSSAICLCWLLICLLFQKLTVQIRYDSLRVCLCLLAFLPFTSLLAGIVLRFFPSNLTFYTLSEKAHHTLYVLGWFFLSGTTFQVFRLVWFNAKYHRKLDAGQIPVPADMLTVYMEVARRMEIQHLPRLKVTASISGPCLKGFLLPIVYLPSETFEQTDWSSVLTHELFHYRNRDLLFRTLLQTATILFWFNPLIYLWQKQAVLVQEQYCDYCTVERYWVNKRNYQLTLLSTARNIRKAVESGAFLSPAGKELKSRILQMNRNCRLGTGKRFLLRIVFSLMVLWTGLTSMMLCANQFDSLNRMQLFLEEGASNGFSSVTTSRPLKRTAVCDAREVSVCSGGTWNSGQFYLRSTEEYLSLTEYINHPGTLIRIGIITPDGKKHYITPNSSWESYQFVLDQTGWYQLHIENRSSGDICINYLIAK